MQYDNFDSGVQEDEKTECGASCEWRTFQGEP